MLCLVPARIRYVDLSDNFPEIVFLTRINYLQTGAALAVFTLAMVLYPDVLKKAQAEIDFVVGRDRLPTFADRDQLPYIRALVKEVLRWKPITPLGLARRAVEDDVYQGYFIPAGSIVMTNVWYVWY